MKTISKKKPPTKAEVKLRRFSRNLLSARNLIQLGAM